MRQTVIPNKRQMLLSKTMLAPRSRETIKKLSGKPRTINRPSKNSEEDVPELSDHLSISKHPEEITSSKLPMMQTVYVPVKGNADIPDKSQTWHSSSGVLAEMTIPENADDNNEKAEETLSHIRAFDRLSKTMPASRSRETIQELSGEPRTISRPKQHSGEDVPEPTDHLSISKHPEEITSSSKLPMMQTVHVPVPGDVDIPNKRQMLQTWHPRSGALSGMPTIETGEESSDPSHSQELDGTSGHHAEENLAPSDHLSISRNPGDVASSSKLLMTQTMQGDAEIPNNRQNIFSKTMPASRSRETVKELSGKPRTISRPSQHSKEDVPELSDQLSISKHPEEITSSSKLQMRQTVHVPVQGDVDIPNKSQTWHSGSGALAGMTIPEIAEDTNEKTEETLSHTREFDRSSEEKGLELSENLSISKHPGGSASSSKLPMMQTVHVPVQGEEKIRNKRQMRQTWHPRSGDLSEKPTLETGEESSVPSHIQELDSTSEHHAEENLALSDHLTISRNPGEVASSSKLPMTQTVQGDTGIHNNRQNMLSKTMPASRSGETIKELSGNPRTIRRSQTRHPRSSALSEMPTIGTGEESSDPSHSQELDSTSRHHIEENLALSDHLSIIKNPEDITSSPKLLMTQTVQSEAEIPNNRQKLFSKTMPASRSGETIKEVSGKPRTISRTRQHSEEEVTELSDHLSISKHIEGITSSSKLPMMQTVQVPVHGGEDIPNKGQMLKTWHPRSDALSEMPAIETGVESSDQSHSQELQRSSQHFEEDVLEMPDHLSISKFPEEITSSSKLPMMQTVHVPVQGDVDIPNKRQMLQTYGPRSGALSGIPTIETGNESSVPSNIQELDSTETNDNLMSEASQAEIEKLQQDLEQIKQKAMVDKENAERKEESLLKKAGELQQHLEEARQEKAIALQEMKDTLNINQRESDKLQNELKNARQKEDELKEKLVGLENELTDTRNKESSLAAKISTLEQECIELREQGERASSELHEKERELEDRRGELQRVQLDLRAKEETIRKYNVKVEKQREDITKLEAEKRKSSEKIAQLETDLSEKESELNDTLNDLEIESSKQVQERNRIETEKQDINTELNREKTRLEEKIRLLTDLSKRNEDLTLKIRLLNAEKTTLNQENEDNKRKLLKLEAEKTTLRRENEGHKRKIQSLEAEKTTLQKEKTKLAQKVKKLEDAKMDAKWNIVNQEDENFGTAASLQDTRMGISASKVETIHLRKASVAKIKEAGYTAYCFVVSMAVVEAGLVIGDSNNCVKCVDVDGDRVLSSLAMEGQIYDMSSFKEMVAIVWRNLGSVKLGIVTVSSKGNLDLGKIIDVQISLEGPILFTGQGFLVSTVGGKVENIDMDGTRLETLLVMTQSTAIGFLTLSHFNGYVYMCVRNEPLLMCFDKKGNIKGKYEMSESDVRKLGMQVGITVDRRGFVYVLCNKGILRLTYDFAEAICVNDSLNGAATITCSPHDDLLFIGYLESDVAESYKIIA